MPNLLSRQPLTQAKALAEVYVVWDGQDYRMSLETLVSLVTKVSLGLGNVNNTPDLEKPVSQAMAAALLGKANKDEVVSNEAFLQFQESLSNFVTQEQLNTAINDVKAIIDQIAGLDPAVVQTMINSALDPIKASLIEFQESLQTQAAAIQALQNDVAGAAKKTEVNEQLAQLEQSIGNQITQLSNGFSNSLQTMSQANAAEIKRLEDAAAARTLEVNTQIQSIVGQIESVTQLMSGLRLDFDNHTHAAGDITGLRDVVEELVGEMPAPGCNIVLTEAQW